MAVSRLIGLNSAGEGVTGLHTACRSRPRDGCNTVLARHIDDGTRRDRLLRAFMRPNAIDIFFLEGPAGVRHEAIGHTHTPGQLAGSARGALGIKCNLRTTPKESVWDSMYPGAQRLCQPRVHTH